MQGLNHVQVDESAGIGIGTCNDGVAAHASSIRVVNHDLADSGSPSPKKVMALHLQWA